MNSFFQIQTNNYSYSVWMISCGQFELCSFIIFFFCKIIKVSHVLYCFIILLHLIYSLLHTRYSLVPYPYVSFESIDFILLSSFELNAILLISSAKTLFPSPLNLYCVFNAFFFFIFYKIFYVNFIFFMFFG